MKVGKRITIGAFLVFLAVWAIRGMDIPPSKKRASLSSSSGSSPLFHHCMELAASRGSMDLFDQEGKTEIHYMIDKLADDIFREKGIADLQELVGALPDLVKLTNIRRGTVPLVAYAVKLYPKTTWIIDVVGILIKSGASVNGYDAVGRTALHFAAIANNVLVTNALLQHGANPNVQTHIQRTTPLHIASACGFENLVEVLLEAGADPCAVDKFGVTPLHFAAGRGQENLKTNTYQLLFKGRSQVPDTAESLARYGQKIQNRCQIIDMLVAKGARADVMDCYNRTPLGYASKYGHEALYEKLMQYLQ